MNERHPQLLLLFKFIRSYTKIFANISNHPSVGANELIFNYSSRRRLATNSVVNGDGGGQQSVKKEHFNVGTIGHIDHGKTTLTAAITKVLAGQIKNKANRYVPFEEIDKAVEERRRGITINVANIGYYSKLRHYAHTDCPGHKDYIKNMIAGTSQMDAAILVLAANDGAMPQTKEHLYLAHNIGVENVIVYINKCDLVDKDIMELVEIEIRELLSEYGIDSERTPVIFGSAICAIDDVRPELGEQSILKLIDELDKLPTPLRDVDGPLRMPITAIYSITGRGTVCVGTLERGRVQKRDSIDIVGYDRVVKSVASDIQIFKQSVPEAVAGDHVGILCRGLRAEDIRRGMIVSIADTPLHNRFLARVYMLSTTEGGRSIPIRNGYSQALLSCNWSTGSRLIFPKSIELMMPGDDAELGVILQAKMPLERGQRFSVRERNIIVLTGVVTELLEPATFTATSDYTKGTIEMPG